MLKMILRDRNRVDPRFKVLSSLTKDKLELNGYGPRIYKFIMNNLNTYLFVYLLSSFSIVVEV